MKKPVYLILFSILMLIVTINVPAYAHGGGGHGGGHVVVGIGPGWGWGWGGGWGWGPWWGYPGYGYGYPYYPSQPVVIQQQQPVYDMQTPQRDEEYYWYFCPDSRNYYPYVKQCPNGWLKVIPPQGPSR